MNIVESLPLMRSIENHQPGWFSISNKQFFGDLWYRGYYGKKTGNRYMVRATNAWTDMFGAEKRLHYRINPIGEKFEILPLIDTIFNDMDEVNDWLLEN